MFTKVYPTACLALCVIMSTMVSSAATDRVLYPGTFPSGARRDYIEVPNADDIVGSESATKAWIHQLINDLGYGSGLLGGCTPGRSYGDRAATELVLIGSPAVQPLIDVISDPNNSAGYSGTGNYDQESRRWFAVQVLGRIGDRAAIPALAYCLSHDPSPKVRAFAPISLGEINDESASAPLILALHDDYPDIQASAADALGVLRSEKAIPDLVALLGEKPCRPAYWIFGDAPHSPLPQVSPDSNAAAALAAIGGPALKALKVALLSKDELVHRYAALGLAMSRSSEANDSVRSLLSDSDSEVRFFAAVGELIRRDKQAVNNITELLHEPANETRQTAAIGLANLGMRGLDALITAANGMDAPASVAADEGLRYIRDSRAIDVLCREIYHGKGQARLSAAESLNYISLLGEAQGTRFILAGIHLLSDPDPKVRSTAVFVVNHISDPRVIGALVKATTDPEDQVRIGATETLGLHMSKSLVDTMMLRLKDPNEYVRGYAARALGFPGDFKAEAELKSMLGGKNWQMELNLQHAIASIESK